MTSTAHTTPACVTSVNVGQVREVTWHGRRIRTGIWKSPSDAPLVMARGVNLDGDDQADRRVHGGPDKAVYSYAEEDYRYWQQSEGLAVTPGLFGGMSFRLWRSQLKR